MDNTCLDSAHELEDFYSDCHTCGLDGDRKDLISGFGGDAYYEIYCEDPGDCAGDSLDTCSARVGWVAR